MFPGLPVPISVTKIPPIPKKGHFRNFEESHLHRRMNALESFLNKVLSMPQLNATTIVVNFLRISDGAEYLKYKKDHTIEENRVPLNKLRSPKGRVRLAIEPKMTKLFTQFRQTFTSTEQRLNKYGNPHLESTRTPKWCSLTWNSQRSLWRDSVVPSWSSARSQLDSSRQPIFSPIRQPEQNCIGLSVH